MKTRYYVCGIGYNKNDCITDYDREFGDFDTVEEAREKFAEVVREAEDNLDEFFLDSEPEVTYWHIQLEKCEETKSEINCIDIIDEIDICKEEMQMKKFEVVVHYEGTINYEVEAQTEDEAKQIAEKMFGDESDTIIAAEITDCGICDCWEMEE